MQERKAVRGPRFSCLALLGIVVGILGVIAPILWDRYKTRSALELQLVSFVTLVEKYAELDKLSIVYDGEILDQISKAEFILLNSGRTPIVEADLVSPPRITFPQEVQVLEAKLESTRPKNVDAKIDFNETANAVIVTFSLLNPGDHVHFSVLTSSDISDFDAEARIVGAELSVASKVQPTEKPKRTVSWVVYPVGVFSSLIILVAFGGGIPQSVREHRVKSAIKNEQFAIPENGTKSTYLSFVNTELSFTTRKERQPLIEMIESFPEGEPLNSDQQAQIRDRIQTVVHSSTSNLPLAIFVLLVGLVGWGYIITQIW